MDRQHISHESGPYGSVGEPLLYSEKPTVYDSAFARDPFSNRVLPSLLENTVQVMLEGVGDEACLLGSDGTILAVNNGWKESTDEPEFHGLRLGSNFIRFCTEAAAQGHEICDIILKGLWQLWRGERIRFEHVFRTTMNTGQPYAKIQMVRLAYRDERYVLVRVHDVTEEKRLKQRRRSLTARLSHARLRERKRMAQELRLCTAGPLGGLQHGLAQLETAVGAQSENAISACTKAIESVQRDVRALSFLWHPPSLADHGLSAALEILVTGFCQRLGISSDVDVDKIGELDPTCEALLYSLAQHALDNVFHQERPTSIRMRMAALTDLHLVIEYDAPLTRPHAIEIGLKTLEEHLEEMDGRLSVHGVLRGTFIAASLPHRRVAH